MFKFKRFLLLGNLAVVLLACLVFTFTIGAPSTVFASAQSCNSVATGSWSYNCTVSQGNISNFAVAIQQSVNKSSTSYNGHTCSTGTLDGNFGTNTYNGVVCFQHAKSISADGIVGPQTWGAMYNMLQYNGTAYGWAYYHMLSSSNGVFAKNTSTGVWWVWFGSSLTSGNWCPMNMSSPCYKP
ncbi:peptidoglycan-binding protein [Ktedonobacteria bacterium brp13]|nr:peptidoglycan-binding protein [Ktedonobacteria bacterium brp13]